MNSLSKVEVLIPMTFSFDPLVPSGYSELSRPLTTMSATISNCETQNGLFKTWLKIQDWATRGALDDSEPKRQLLTTGGREEQQTSIAGPDR